MKRFLSKIINFRRNLTSGENRSNSNRSTLKIEDDFAGVATEEGFEGICIVFEGKVMGDDRVED